MVANSVQNIIEYSKKVEVKNTVKLMKKLVPEFISKNSSFCEFDD